MFPASRLLISTVTAELADLNKGFASFKRIVEGDPNLRPRSPKGSSSGAPPSPAVIARTPSTGSVGGGSSGGGGESDGTMESSPQSTKSEKLATLSMQKTENRKCMAGSGKVGRGGGVGFPIVEGGMGRGWGQLYRVSYCTGLVVVRVGLECRLKICVHSR